MKCVVLFLALCVPIVSQGSTIRVAASDVAAHLKKHPAAIYPPLAQQTRISGVVILEIAISETGNVLIRRVVSGHPLRKQAAINAVSRWQYEPFQDGSQPATAIAWVKVGFGSTRSQETEADAELRFLYGYWNAMDKARQSLVEKDFDIAAQQLKADEEMLTDKTVRTHPLEHAEWLSLSASLATAQSKLPEAEDKYSRALEILEQVARDSPATAQTLALLGDVYLREEKYDRERDTLGKAVNLYTELFEEARDRGSNLRTSYGSAVASISLSLSRSATQQKDQAELVKNCKVILEFRNYLSESERNLVASVCQQTAPQ
jgi:TonB family protein